MVRSARFSTDELEPSFTAPCAMTVSFTLAAAGIADAATNVMLSAAARTKCFDEICALKNMANSSLRAISNGAVHCVQSVGAGHNALASRMSDSASAAL